MGGSWTTFFTAQKIADGPLIVTDIFASDDYEWPVSNTTRAMLYIADNADCQIAPYPADPRIAALARNADKQTAIHGARLLVPAGKVLCGVETNPMDYIGFRVIWSGYRPYE